ncbi:hypothetical protein GCM10023165_12020 [Variovorax defluvii]|uniref:Uncharacterized protein n=1 Tax=Variovorax defluvii TaxID=913761 RepID=A0ABP8H890_9BURK
MHLPLRVLYEIRLRWSDEVPQEAPGQEGGLWYPDTDCNRTRLDEAVARGNRLYGDHTHWVEKRQA